MTPTRPFFPKARGTPPNPLPRKGGGGTGGPILAIDTSTATASVAVYDDRVLAETTWRVGRHQSRALVPVLDACLKLAGTDRTALAAVALASGPGSYSGLRVGASTAIGLGLSLGVEIIQVPTLEIIAYSLGGQAETIRAAVEVGRGRYASALYRGTPTGPEQRTEIESMDLGELLARVRAEGALLGGEFEPVVWNEVARQGKQGLHPEGEARAVVGLAVAVRRAGFLAELAANRRGDGAGAGGSLGQLIYLPN